MRHGRLGESFLWLQEFQNQLTFTFREWRRHEMQGVGGHFPIFSQSTGELWEVSLAGIDSNFDDRRTIAIKQAPKLFIVEVCRR